MIADKNQRLQALDASQSFVITAPAGSGKTGLLTQRMLSLLAECERPESILCMTFTRKAAAEMRLRIGEALKLGNQPEAPTDQYTYQNWQLARRVLERDRAKNWQIMRSPNRLQITTIDGLCRLLAQQMAIESGLGTIPENTETPTPLYREAVRDLFSELETPGRTGEALAVLLQHLDNNHQQLEDLLIGLIGKREQWLALVLDSQDARGTLQNALARLIADLLEKAQMLMSPFYGELQTLLDYIAQHLPDNSLNDTRHLASDKKELLNNIDASLAFWQSLCGIFLTNSGSWRKQADKKIGLPIPKDSSLPEQAGERKTQWKNLIVELKNVPGLLETLNDLVNLPTPFYSDPQWEVLDALTCLLPQLAARLQLVFQAKGTCDFTETALAAQRALGSVGQRDFQHGDAPTDLTLRLDYRIQHILVDESQDTSSLQFDLLRRLTAGWQMDDGRTLFLVGDAMQSLYGFRNANVGLFLDCRHHPIGDLQLNALELCTNFRSRASIVEWVNRVFSRAFPAVEDSSRGATPYVNSTTPDVKENADNKNRGNCSEPIPSVTLDTFHPEATDREEGEQVARRVLAAQQHQPEGKIAILVRGRSHLKEILPALYRHQISWQANDIDPLGGRMPVIDLLSLTRALLCPADRIAWLSLLRAPWSGFNHQDLHTIATWASCQEIRTAEPSDQRNDHQEKNEPLNRAQTFPLIIQQLFSIDLPKHLTIEGSQILQRLREVIEPAWQQRHRKPLRTWIEGIWINLGGPAALLQPSVLQQCRQYFDVLESNGSEAMTDWPTFVDIVNRSTVAPEANADPRLQILTIHKAKGLEFDTVIIPGLHRRSKNNQKELLMWREYLDTSGKIRLILSPPASSGEDTDSIYQHLRREQALKARLEDTRVLYVACTRAKSHLHLLFRLPSKDSPEKNSPLALLWETLSEDLNSSQHNSHSNRMARVTHHAYPETDEGLTDKEESNHTEALNLGVRLPPHWSISNYPELKLATAKADAKSTDTLASTTQNKLVIPQPESLQERALRFAGTLFHRTARQIVVEGIELWDKKRIKRQKNVWRCELESLLQRRATEQTTIENLLDKLERAVTQILNHSEGRWLLQAHQEHVCEWPLAYIDAAGQARTAILDRSFVDQNVRWIIDYKFSEPHVEQTLADFLTTQQSAYYEQLNLYRNLLNNENTSSVKLALYFPLIPHLDSW